jgi:hypothetical protein
MKNDSVDPDVTKICTNLISKFNGFTGRIWAKITNDIALYICIIYS